MMRSFLQAGAGLGDRLRAAGEVDAVGAAARRDQRGVLDDERDIVGLDRAGEALDALDPAAVVAIGEAQQDGGDIAAGHGLHQAEGHGLGVRDGRGDEHQAGGWGCVCHDLCAQTARSDVQCQDREPGDEAPEGRADAEKREAGGRDGEGDDGGEALLVGRHGLRRARR